MPVYTYRALDSQGRKLSGECVSDDENAAARQLQQKGYLVLSLKQGKRLGGKRGQKSAFTPRELVRMTQQLSTLLLAGQPLVSALSTLMKQPRRQPQITVLSRITEQVKAGSALGDALAEHPATFSAFYISLVRAGEAGGVLDTALGQLTEYLERSHNLRGEVVNALIYPVFLVIGVIGSVALLLAYVVPQFVPIFNDLGVPIPGITRAILLLGELVNAWGGIGVVIGLSLLLVWQASRRNPTRRTAQDRKLLATRGIGPLVQRLEVARLARTLGTLLENGVTLVTALTIARDVNTNHAVRALVVSACDEVKQGSTFTDAISHPPLLPELAVQMISVGEQSSTLGPMLLKVADVFDAEAKQSIARVMAALVPTLTIIMAVMVAAIMLAIMLPLMSLTSSM